MEANINSPKKFQEKYYCKKKKESSKQKLMLNITYLLVFQNVRNILQKLNLLLANNKEHNKVFPDVPAVGIRNCKSLKDYLVRAVLIKIIETGKCESYGKKACLVFKSIRFTTTFTTETCGKTFKIHSGS